MKAYLKRPMFHALAFFLFLILLLKLTTGDKTNWTTSVNANQKNHSFFGYHFSDHDYPQFYRLPLFSLSLAGNT